MPLLQFFMARLRGSGSQRSVELYLRHRHQDQDDVDLSGSEPVLGAFSFPLGPDAVPAKEFMASEEYTFTLTYGDGRRFQGFARKFLPPAPRVGSKLRLPEVAVIITECPWFQFYFKVLQVLEQLLRTDHMLGTDNKQLPASCAAGLLLKELGEALTRDPAPGEIVKLVCPAGVISSMAVSPPRFSLAGAVGDALNWSDEALELQVPPDCGNGRWNCGISLARLLWHVPVPAMVTLVASMLLERRIILVGQSRDTVTAAVQAAAALLFPFRWHHIYLPLMPKSLKDYLMAPMPFLVGLPAQMLPILRGIPMDEVVMIDLDLGKCEPAPGSERDDARLLPWREYLEAAFTAAYANLRSPTEYESSPIIAGIMQEWFCKLIGSFQRFIHDDSPQLNGQGPFSPRSCAGGQNNSHHGPSPRSAATSGAGTQQDLSRHTSGAVEDGLLRGSGLVFEHQAFVTHRRNENARRFLGMLRHSQMYEVFVQERLKATAEGQEGSGLDGFAERLARYQERKHERLAARRAGVRLAAAPQAVKQHRRLGSDEPQTSNLGGGPGSMRRIMTDASVLSEQRQTPLLDPASFFGDDDDLDDCFLDDTYAANLRSPYPEGLSGDGASSSYHLSRPQYSDLARASAPNLAPRTSTPPPKHLQQLLQRQPSSNAGAPACQMGAGPGRPELFHSPQQGPAPAESSGTGGLPSPPGRGTAASSSAAAGVAATPNGKSGLVLSFTSGNKTYEGSLRSVAKEWWSDAKRTLAGPAEGRAQQSGASSSEQQQHPGMFKSLLGGGGGGHASGWAGAGSERSSASATGYRPQLTGDSSKLRQSAAAAIGSLLDGADGRLKQPPAPSRPLTVQQPAPAPAGPGPQKGTAPAASSAAVWDPFGSAPAPGASSQQPDVFDPFNERASNAASSAVQQMAGLQLGS